MTRDKTLRALVITAATVLAAGALAGCATPEESTDENTGPQDETGSPRDAEDTTRGETEAGDGNATTGDGEPGAPQGTSDEGDGSLY